MIELKRVSDIPSNVTHPSHYCSGRKYEPKDVIRDWDLNFNKGNAVKYLSRAGRKESATLTDIDKEIEDLRKAQTYIGFEIEYLTNLKTENADAKLGYTE